MLPSPFFFFFPLPEFSLMVVYEISAAIERNFFIPPLSSLFFFPLFFFTYSRPQHYEDNNRLWPAGAAPKTFSPFFPFFLHHAFSAESVSNSKSAA